MSEYWVSKKKYYCKYCEIYITDDAPSRRQHENGLRHQGNKERFVRGLYKASEKRKQDTEEEKREMARVEQVRALSLLCLLYSSVYPGCSSSFRTRCRLRHRTREFFSFFSTRRFLLSKTHRSAETF
ncbi:hypothetical protein NEOLEDRAFT_1128596 [Neolentinus lepideus HHB14362 ss-1]|uniref:Matrin-type domain-containing protein n=1 Tax=Neolentinus lepideus HHB14362 ss-1 TaxID=1314782 RepID=A0A165V2P6_9AGAM|nr:hypothetical protein NEOLEDRAFT_1128596 [Neolentinus lepideus HHB14362 ss-1]